MAHRQQLLGLWKKSKACAARRGESRERRGSSSRREGNDAQANRSADARYRRPGGRSKRPGQHAPRQLCKLRQCMHETTNAISPSSLAKKKYRPRCDSSSSSSKKR
uniref:Uncharacterized protein n=1 Tax=Odontella aurita TaxID=265563 RepID=A0A7S4JRH8_9STRA|mmetsp:Transcript_52448/g.157327  ORF Transcript_52448/g.157327 Transcript_52448/m.157327 type:complete len:106 (+) Transcript_52448:493-810(+)